MQTPVPGIYEKVSFDDYLSWDAISNSSLQAGLKSMAHYRWQKPIEATRPMILGTLTHTAKLEPSSVNERFAFMPDFTPKVQEMRKAAGKDPAERPRATNEHKQLVKEFAEKNAGKQVITEKEFTSLIGMVRALSEHQTARQLLSGGRYELSIVWDDPQTGLRCKGRIDCEKAAAGQTVDLKTSINCHRLSWAIAFYGYHRQAAFYSDGMQVLTGRVYRPSIVAVEPEGPYHGVIAAPLSMQALLAGRSQYRGLLRQIAECKRSGVWPGFEEPEELFVPDYAVPDTLEVDARAETVVSW